MRILHIGPYTVNGHKYHIHKEPVKYICPHGCGTLVANPRQHEKWHQQLEKR